MKFLSWIFLLPAISAFTVQSAKDELHFQYFRSSQIASDISEHLPVLRSLAAHCSSAIEIGVRDIVSTWGILRGLADSPFPSRSYLGIDLVRPHEKLVQTARRLSEANGISFSFWEANDMAVDLPPADLLFIDSLHTYCHLTYELETFCGRISKYIALHDTSDPWGMMDDWEYRGDFSEYPSFIDRTKRGLWPAVEDFLLRHPEWRLLERRLNCHGLTVLYRIPGE